MEPVFASHFQVCLVPGTYGAGASWCLAPTETVASKPETRRRCLAPLGDHRFC